MTDELIRMAFDHRRRIGALEALDHPRGWVLISETVLAASATSVVFSSLPDDYRTLAIIVKARTDRGAENDIVRMRFNADTGNNYDYIVLYAQGGAGATDSTVRATSSIYWAMCEGANSRANNFSPSIGYVFDYTSASHEKWAMASSAAFGNRDAQGDLYKLESGGAWRSTNAITSVTFFPSVGPNFVSGCQFTVYGIL